MMNRIQLGLTLDNHLEKNIASSLLFFLSGGTFYILVFNFLPQHVCKSKQAVGIFKWGIGNIN